MSTANILLVDDEPLNLEIVSEYLSTSPHTLLTAKDGESGWTTLLAASPPIDAILLDRMMPGLDGMGLLGRIKADSRFIDVPVIMQSAAGTPAQIDEGLHAGAYYYLTKPYRRDALLGILHAALSDRQARLQLRAQLEAHAGALHFLREGRFVISSVAEASCLAAFIAEACPQPDSAILGISELLVNAVEHGNLGITYEEKAQLKQSDNWQAEVLRRAALPENRGKRVSLDYRRDEDQIKLRITDEGSGFDWQQFLDFDPARAFDPNGRGIALARLMSFSTLHYECGGRMAVVSISLTGQPPVHSTISATLP